MERILNNVDLVLLNKEIVLYIYGTVKCTHSSRWDFGCIHASHVREMWSEAWFSDLLV